MNRLRALSLYASAYVTQATQLATYANARAWMEADVPVDQAVRWADAGYLPSEALPLIAAGKDAPCLPTT